MLRRLRRIVRYAMMLVFGVPFLAAFSLLLVLAVDWVYGDEALNPEIPAFYQLNTNAYTKDNVAFAFAGLSAPSSVKDSAGWASALITKYRQKRDEQEAALKQQGRWQILTQFYTQPSLGWGLQDMLDAVPGKTSLKGNTRGIICLIAHPAMVNAAALKPCATKKEARAVISDNALLLERYDAIANYKRLISLPRGGWPNMQLLISVHELYLLRLTLESESRPEASLKRWLANQALLRRGMADQNDLISRSVLLVLHKMSQQALPVLLAHADAALLKRYEPALLQALTPMGSREMNVAFTLKADYQLIAATVDRLDNASRNKFYEFTKDFIALSEVPASQFAESNAGFQARYKAWLRGGDWHNLPMGIITNLIISGMAVASDLIGAMHSQDALNRMLALHVQMMSQGVRPEQVPAFLSAAPAGLRDPFRDAPFRYDAKEEVIYYVIPSSPQMRHAVPAPSSAPANTKKAARKRPSSP